MHIVIARRLSVTVQMIEDFRRELDETVELEIRLYLATLRRLRRKGA